MYLQATTMALGIMLMVVFVLATSGEMPAFGKLDESNAENYLADGKRKEPNNFFCMGSLSRKNKKKPFSIQKKQVIVCFMWV